MQAIVIKDQRGRWIVTRNNRPNRYGLVPIQNADRIAATKIPVPVALSQLKRNSAGFGIPSPPMTLASGLINWSKYGTFHFRSVIPDKRFGRSYQYSDCSGLPPSSTVRNCGTPQTKTQID